MGNIEDNFEWSKVEGEEPSYTKFSQELHKDIERISEKLIYNRFLLNSLIELNNNASESNIYKQYPVFTFIKQAFYYQAILETYKLYNPKEGYNLPKLINILTNNFKRITWYTPSFNIDVEVLDNKQKKEKERLIREQIRRLLKNSEEDLFTKDTVTIFGKIKIIRNNYLGHNNKVQKKVTVTLEELLFLQEIAEKVSNKLGNALYGTSTGYFMQDNDMVTGVLLRLRVFEEIRQFVLQTEGRGEENIKTKTLLEMVRFRNIANPNK